MPGNRNWAWDPLFDADSLGEFEMRLARANKQRRPGYLRVRGMVLLQLDDPGAEAVALDLLRRAVEMDGPREETARAHVLLGEAFQRRGEHDHALASYRRAIESADSNRNGIGVPELPIAEVLIEQGAFEEASEMLRSIQGLKRGLLWDSDLFRFAVAAARCNRARETGIEDAASWAQEALDIAGGTDPQDPRHPTLGRPRPDAETLAEMQTLATSGANRPQPPELR